MKKIFLTLVIFFTVVFAGCSNDFTGAVSGDVPQDATVSKRFVSMGIYYRIGDCDYILYEDARTHRLYLCNTFYHGSGIAPLYDASGEVYTREQFESEQK